MINVITIYSQRFFLEPSFETRNAYNSYSPPEPLSWQYPSTGVNSNIKIASVLDSYGL